MGGGPQLCSGARFPTAEKPLTSVGGYSVLQAVLGSQSFFFLGGARSDFPALSESPPPTPGKRELGNHPLTGVQSLLMGLAGTRNSITNLPGRVASAQGRGWGGARWDLRGEG